MTAQPDLSSPGAWPQTASLELLRAVMEIAGDVRLVISSRAELSVTEVHALEHLARGPIGPAEIARLLDVSTAASTGIVDRLEAKGHVTRRPHPQDRRRTEVVITPHARDEVIRHLGPMFRRIGEVDARLTPDEREVVVRYLSAALEAAGAVLHGEHTEG